MRFLGKLLLAVMVVSLAWLVLVLSESLPRPSARERAALEVFRSDASRATGDRNAFAALHLFQYDIPPDALEAVAAADVESYEARVRNAADGEFVSTAEGKYPKLAPVSWTDAALCSPWEPDCLKLVRENLDTTRKRVAELALHLQRTEALHVYDHSRYAFEPRLNAPVGADVPGLVAGIMTSAALEFVDGRVDAAFARLCRNTATWRRLRSHTDSVVVDMVGANQMSGAARLYAEMLAELPAGFDAPCPEAFAPLTDAELDQCGVFRTEFRLYENTIRNLGPGDLAFKSELATRIAVVLVNKRHAIAAAAGSFGRYCLPEHRALAAARTPIVPERRECEALGWTFDPLGCALYEAVPGYDVYYHRLLDLDARLKLLSSAIWLRTRPHAGDRATQFAARPGNLHSAEHEMRYDATADRLMMRNVETKHGESWWIPLAAKRAE